MCRRPLQDTRLNELWCKKASAADDHTGRSYTAANADWEFGLSIVDPVSALQAASKHLNTWTVLLTGYMPSRPQTPIFQVDFATGFMYKQTSSQDKRIQYSLLSTFLNPWWNEAVLEAKVGLIQYYSRVSKKKLLDCIYSIFRNLNCNYITLQNSHFCNCTADVVKFLFYLTAHLGCHKPAAVQWQKRIHVNNIVLDAHLSAGDLHEG